jgi:hypothetical protein
MIGRLLQEPRNAHFARTLKMMLEDQHDVLDQIKVYLLIDLFAGFRKKNTLIQSLSFDNI